MKKLGLLLVLLTMLAPMSAAFADMVITSTAGLRDGDHDRRGGDERRERERRERREREDRERRERERWGRRGD